MRTQGKSKRARLTRFAQKPAIRRLADWLRKRNKPYRRPRKPALTYRTGAKRHIARSRSRSRRR